jgi:N-hydroxyarylamine O-acetyltransferase
MTSPDRLAAYLARLGLDAAPAPDAAGLARLTAAHRQRIAFENVDVRLGRPIRIDSDSAFDKLVTRGRGGYCFEQNRLFSDMLAALGLPNRPLLARVRLGLPPGEVPPRTHVLLLTELDGAPWIVDAGFGGSHVPPMPLQDGATAETDDGAAHRLRRIGYAGDLAGQWLLERAGPVAATDGRAFAHSDWQPQYSFDLSPVAPADLELSNHWTSTRPDSRFTMLTIASIVLPGGFVSLVDGALRISHGDDAETHQLETIADYRAALRDHLNLAISETDVAALPLFAG